MPPHRVRESNHVLQCRQSPAWLLDANRQLGNQWDTHRTDATLCHLSQLFLRVWLGSRRTSTNNPNKPDILTAAMSGESCCRRVNVRGAVEIKQLIESDGHSTNPQLPKIPDSRQRLKRVNKAKHSAWWWRCPALRWVSGKSAKAATMASWDIAAPGHEYDTLLLYPLLNYNEIALEASYLGILLVSFTY